LNAAKAGADDPRQGFHRQRFGSSGHAFDQGVTFGQQRDQDLFNRFILADDDFAQFVLNVGDG
jgi:hypothetical protein